MYQIRLSADAEMDLESMYAYTYIEYGEQQWARYESLFTKAFEQIARFPEIGVQRSDIPSYCRALLTGRHVIVYRVEKEVISVLRILHQRMDFTHQFGQKKE